MFLSDVYDQLTSGELSKIYAGDTGTILPEVRPRINSLIQAGIADINKHFTIREGTVLIRTSNERENYELIPANSVNVNPQGFIMDSPLDPFLGDIMQINRITDSTGQSLWLNTDVPARMAVDNIFGTRPSIYTYAGINMSSYNTLKLHKNHTYGDLLVHYKARIKPFEMTTPEATYIDLPDHFLNALVWYVASRKFNPNGAETIGRGMFHEGNNYRAMYNEEVASLKAQLGSIASTGESTNFERNGWV